MKKIILAIITSALIVTLAACGQGGNSSSSEASSASSASQKQEQQEAKEQEEKSTEPEESDTIQDCKYTKDNPLVIEIDPGHGGGDGGAEAVWNGETVLEKDVNLRLAVKLANQLRKFENVKVIMTREDDTASEIHERIAKAADDKADLVVSVHNNAYGKGFRYKDGCMVLAATGNLDEEKAKEDQLLGAYILRELAKAGPDGAGPADRGLLLRYNEDGETYENGKLQDYYGVVRRSALAGFTGIVIEHGYLDNEKDYNNYLSTDEQLERLAEADARGIAAYYRLIPVKKETEKYKTQHIIMVDENDENTQYLKEEYDLNLLD